MIEAFFIAGFLSVSLVFALLACTARSTERLLWGTVLCSLGLGVAAQISGGGYYGLVMLAVFLATDLVIYMYFRTQGLLPSRPPKNPRADRIFRVVFLWLGITAVAGGALPIFQPEMGLPAKLAEVPGMSLLHERIWANDWLLILVPSLTLVGLMAGGFFLVRRERR
jgi:hypothetical protein